MIKCLLTIIVDFADLFKWVILLRDLAAIIGIWLYSSQDYLRSVAQSIGCKMIKIGSYRKCFIKLRDLGAAVAEWLSSCLVDQEVRGSIPRLATWISEIGYLLLPSRDMAEIPLERRKSSIQPTNQSCISSPNGIGGVLVVI